MYLNIVVLCDLAGISSAGESHCSLHPYIHLQVDHLLPYSIRQASWRAVPLQIINCSVEDV